MTPPKPTQPGTPTDESAAYRRIPPVNSVVERLIEAGWAERLPRSVITDAARAVIDEHRASLPGPRTGPGTEPASTEALADRAAARLADEARPPLAPVINATGIILHTGLGRAPMAEPAVAAMADVARHYAPVELVMSTGERGKRSTIVRQLLCRLTGAESATVVNNNTAALVIVLSAIARDRNVIVSRGELIEIGGSFRLPEVIQSGGAILREVGTTNKTKLGDYERAVDDHAAAIVKIHTSNYRIEGFTEEASIEELAKLGHRHALPVIHDIGSGVLVEASRYGLSTAEPDARASIEAGADLVLFSGDKLLGGPQAGIIVGRAALIERIEKHPLMRAVRVDKLTLAALGVTLQLHRDPDGARQAFPVLAAVEAPMETLEDRAERIVQHLKDLAGVREARFEAAQAYLGGGSLPAQAVPSLAVAVVPAKLSDEAFATRLRAGSPPVVPRVRGGLVWFDLRTVFPAQDEPLLHAIESALK
ncbi:MAG: L-seryl-tRNA(Sec) selenium transferase [Planctomycetota bacterium]|nr:L-seryl-tRNA(Sec) selenium transferase [Planctomycetota bacterium]